MAVHLGGIAIAAMWTVAVFWLATLAPVQSQVTAGRCEGDGLFKGDGTFMGNGEFISKAGTFDGIGVFTGKNSTYIGTAKCRVMGTMRSRGVNTVITGDGFFRFFDGDVATVEDSSGSFDVEGPTNFTAKETTLSGTGQLFGEGEIDGDLSVFGDFECDGQGMLLGDGTFTGEGKLVAKGRFRGEGTLTGTGTLDGEGTCVGGSVGLAMAPSAEIGQDDLDLESINFLEGP